MPATFLSDQPLPSPSARARQDSALVQTALAGQAQAYDDLLTRYRQSVRSLSLKLLRDKAQAEDLTTETFGQAFRYLNRYPPTGAFSTWLFRIATNHCLDHLRRPRLPMPALRTAQPDYEGGRPPLARHLPDPDPQDVFVRQHPREAVQQAIAQLPDKYQRLGELFYLQAHRDDEVAIELQLPLGTVKAQLMRVRKLLLALLPPPVRR